MKALGQGFSMTKLMQRKQTCLDTLKAKTNPRFDILKTKMQAFTSYERKLDKLKRNPTPMSLHLRAHGTLLNSHVNMAMQGPKFAKKQGNMDIMAHYPRHMPIHAKPTHPLYPFIMHTHGLRNKRPYILTI